MRMTFDRRQVSADRQRSRSQCHNDRCHVEFWRNHCCPNRCSTNWLWASSRHYFQCPSRECVWHVRPMPCHAHVDRRLLWIERIHFRFLDNDKELKCTNRLCSWSNLRRRWMHPRPVHLWRFLDECPFAKSNTTICRNVCLVRTIPYSCLHISSHILEFCHLHLRRDREFHWRDVRTVWFRMDDNLGENRMGRRWQYLCEPNNSKRHLGNHCTRPNNDCVSDE